MSESDQNNFPAPDPDMHARMKKRNRVVWLSLGVFVIALMVISYFRIKGLAPLAILHKKTIV